MGSYPITIVVILAGAIGLIFLLRFGIRQNAKALTATPEPGATGLLAILSFVVALIVAPIGVVLAHVALSRVGTGEATGRPWAYAAMWVGYIAIALEVGAVVYLYQTNYWT